MSWRVMTLLVVGTLVILLGGLWVLQGADAVHVRPVLCVTNCKPITGGSTGWLTAGILTVLVGLLAIGAGARQLHRRAGP